MSEKPNIVLVSWDSVRADHMPTYGYERDTTPYLSSIEDEGLVFDNTHVSAVGTPASFTGVFTGEHSDGVMLNPTPSHWTEANRNRKFLSEYLQDEGYHTGAFHMNALMSSDFGWDRGWDEYSDGHWDKGRGDEEDDGGFDAKKAIYDQLQKVDMANFATHLKKLTFKEQPNQWEEMWDDISGFVETAPEPWFMWVLLIDTHHPYYAPKEWHEWEQPGVRSTYALNYFMRRNRDLVGERRPSIINSYDNTLRYADGFVEKLHDKLESEGYGDEPFIFHSDHGDEMGEHAHYGHRPLMYNTVTQVPLMMWNVGETGRREGPHSLLDLGNAILDVAGSDARMGQGKSLLSEERETITIQNLLGDIGRCAAVVDDEWKVLYHPEGEWGQGEEHVPAGKQAFKISDGPLEKTDRYGEHPSELEEALDEQLLSEVTMVEEEGEVSGDVQERLSELGYIE